LTVSGTVAGLVALFSFKTHVPEVNTAATTPATPTLSASAPPKTAPAPTPSASKPASTKPKKTPAKTPATTQPATTPTYTPPTTAPSTSAPPVQTTRTITGPEEQTQYGPVQVTITVTGSHITNASGSLLGQGDNTSNEALPQLNSEAVSAQSANIQTVSGATYTSNGYRQSLQSALDQAGI
jgi:uncharacterized protein with FMN-binding domain